MYIHTDGQRGGWPSTCRVHPRPCDSVSIYIPTDAFEHPTPKPVASSKQAALHAADVAVVNDDTDVQVISDHQSPKRWPSGEPLVVAGVEFERDCSSRYVSI